MDIEKKRIHLDGADDSRRARLANVTKKDLDWIKLFHKTVNDSKTPHLKMHPKTFVVSTLVFGACLLRGETPSLAHEAFSPPQILSQAEPLFVSATPFLLSVTWMPNGRLLVSPDWISLANPEQISRMQMPPAIRTHLEAGQLFGEFQLRDGTWAPIFSAPAPLSSEESPTNETQGRSKNSPSSEVKALANLKAKDSAVSSSALSLPSTSARDLVVNDVSTSSRANRLILNVDAVNGDDRWDGRALKKSSILGGKVRGPGKNLKTILAAALESPDGEVEIVLAPGTYRWSGIPAHGKSLTITPMDGVTIDFEENVLN